MSTEEINTFLAKKSKAAIVLEMLLNREYVTCSDIINYYKESEPDCPAVFTTNPQKLIETIRKNFGYDFVQDREVKFFRKQYTATGKEFKISDTYKQYFLNKVGA